MNRTAALFLMLAKLLLSSLVRRTVSINFSYKLCNYLISRSHCLKKPGVFWTVSSISVTTLTTHFLKAWNVWFVSLYYLFILHSSLPLCSVHHLYTTRSGIYICCMELRYNDRYVQTCKSLRKFVGLFYSRFCMGVCCSNHKIILIYEHFIPWGAILMPCSLLMY